MAQAAVAVSHGDTANDINGAVLLDRQYALLPQRPLPVYDSPHAKAYLAGNLTATQAELVALVCDQNVPPRYGILRDFAGVNHDRLMRPITWGVVDWPLASRRHFAILFQRPPARRLMETCTAETGGPDGASSGWDEVRLTRLIIRPVSEILRLFSKHHITHRAIRPTNMFYDPAGQGRVVLGEGLTVPAAMDQPALFEPIEQAMAMPAGRGAGYLADDLYALGVTILVLAQGGHPFFEFSDHEVIARKIAQGSFSALAPRARLSIGLRELVRGLLVDDPAERWDLDDIDQWLLGRRRSPISPTSSDATTWAYKFNNVHYRATQPLAHAMAGKWNQAVPEIRKEEFLQWSKRMAAADETLASALKFVREKAHASRRAVGRAAEGDVDLARYCQAMDLAAPIRYRGFSAHPEGFGTALACHWREESFRLDFREALIGDLVSLPLEIPGARVNRNPVPARRVQRLARSLISSDYGTGTEYALYSLNPTLHCLSPLIETRFVQVPGDILPALEHVVAAATASLDKLPIDRHLAAFIAARHNGDLSASLAQIGNKGEPGKAALETLRVLAILQHHYGPAHAGGVTKWMSRFAEPMIATYHNRTLRERLTAKLPEILGKGDLVALWRYLSNPTQRQFDTVAFEQARAEYRAAEDEIDALQTAMPHLLGRSVFDGHRLAASIAYGLVGVMASVIAIVGVG